MLYFLTGVPGSGKTLNLIQEFSRKKEFKGRPIYYHDINLTDEGKRKLKWLYLEDPKKWFECPPNAVIIIDEAWKHFPQVRANAQGAKPDHYQKIAEHRHEGQDIVLVTQKPNEIDSFFRGRVYEHTNLLPMKVGSTNAEAFTIMNQCIEIDANGKMDPQDKAKATKKTFIYDKKYYGYYTSAEIHTKKFRMDKRLFYAVPVVGGCIAVFIFAVSTLPGVILRGEKQGPEMAEQGSVADGTSTSRLPFLKNQLPPVKAYIDKWTPRISGIQSTAPIFDEITQDIKNVPIAKNCVCQGSRCDQPDASATTRCQCYTDQGTKVSVPDSYCRSIIRDGYFDFYTDMSPKGST